MNVKKNIVPGEQYGFRVGHSTEEQALRLAQSVIARINGSYSCSALFMDVEKAFDKVWNEELVHKMSQLGLKDDICKLVPRFLSNRKFKVRIESSSFKEKPIEAGVP